MLQHCISYSECTDGFWVVFLPDLCNIENKMHKMKLINLASNLQCKCDNVTMLYFLDDSQVVKPLDCHKQYT